MLPWPSTAISLGQNCTLGRAGAREREVVLPALVAEERLPALLPGRGAGAGERAPGRVPDCGAGAGLWVPGLEAGVTARPGSRYCV